MKLILLLIGIFLFQQTGKAQNFNEPYAIIGDSINMYPTINSILELEEFHNKVVFVDIWGTRCPPCLKEFKYIPALKEKFSKDSVVFLYLCSPYTNKWDKQNETRWKDLIYKNKLEGIHIFMSVECYSEGFFEKYKDKYTEDRMYAIPTFLLVDKSGEIVNFNAPRPSSGEVLYNEIESLLSKK